MNVHKTSEPQATTKSYWMKPIMTLLVMGVLAVLAPVAPIDPWHLLSPKKIVTMIFALAMVQVLGSALALYLGTRAGALLTGFLGGLVSSTATTASLARRSKVLEQPHASGEGLTFLSATCAMLFEALILVVSGTKEIHLSTLLIFILPLVFTVLMIFIQYRDLKMQNSLAESPTFKILPILKLSLFIIGILTLSKVLQNIWGQNGLLVVTAVVSLFEIHGSVIANVQLHDSEAISVPFLCSLLAISVVSSYVSKLFLISTLGSQNLKRHVLKSTLVVFGALAMGWALAMSIG